MHFLTTILHLAAAEIGGPHFPYAATSVIFVGFIAAASIGSIAWYNSRRPLGWENKERPDGMPEIDS